MVTDVHICCYRKMGFINNRISYVGCAEPVYCRVQKRVYEPHFHTLGFAAEHGKCPLGVITQVDFRKLRYPVPRLSREAHVTHPVHTIGPHFFIFIVKGQEIIISVVYQQLVRADGITLPFPALDLLGDIADRRF